MNSHYALDKHQAKMLGVCAGLARMTGWDISLIRIGAVLATLVLGPILIILYAVTALVSQSR